MKSIELFDLTRAHPAARGFSGAVLIAGYIYYAPLNNGQFHGRVLRFNTASAFDDPAAWDSFDCALIHPAARGFVNALTDGRHVYLVPYTNGKHHGHVVRYDTRRSFTDPTSWQEFDATQLHSECRGYISGCHDGRYIYLAPYQLDWGSTHGRIVRFDTTQDFGSALAWESLDATRVHPAARGFHSACAAGDHVYFIPYLLTGKQYNGCLMRYDRRLPWDDPQAWQHIDLATLDAGCLGYVGAVTYEGRLYLAPYLDGVDRHGRVVCLDLTRDWSDRQAWSVFDCAQVDAGSRGFFGAICAAQQLYLIPHCRGIGQYHGQLTRCDLSRGFTHLASWSTCDLALVHPDLRGFMGGVIDGGWLYLPPFETDAGQHSGLAVRVRLDCPEIWHPHQA
jgi:hypothetical protein